MGPKRRAMFFIVFFIAIIIGYFSLGIEETWLKKLILISLTLFVFAFSETVRQICDQVRKELFR
ncbi:hypothetical protein D1B31_12015 [Neobacillus notoginsengisoli]|uniref:Uncharacterized protein n=1 Tax=Neobacillus notoginsengisoli TaxID=1578198 RepID=A0A417YT88_9BACI|nr:hypothetical protein [Neobacillus notoginsengisoli]RHW40274.1 hypothetical protein D1B31_12015 [Neobacillus notoginsengisoli]